MTNAGQSSNAAQLLPEILLFGVAKPCVYSINGKYINNVYHIALEVTDHTDEGTYTSTFPLKSLYDFWDDELSIIPSDLAASLVWLKNAFGRSGGNTENAPTWIPATGGEKIGKSSRARLQVICQPMHNYKYTATLRLPPDSFPLLGNLNHKSASEVRANISSIAIQVKHQLEARLDEFEPPKPKTAATATTAGELPGDKDAKVEEAKAAPAPPKSKKVKGKGKVNPLAIKRRQP